MTNQPPPTRSSTRSAIPSAGGSSSCCATAPPPSASCAGRLPVGRPAVSKHLRTLRAAGLITYRTAGTRNLYALAPEGLTEAQQWLVRTWDVALQSYAQAVRYVAPGEDTNPPGKRPAARRRP